MHIVCRGGQPAMEVSRWLSSQEGGPGRSPVVLYDEHLHLQGTEVCVWGVNDAPEKLCLLKLHGFELRVPGLSIPNHAQVALCFFIVRRDFNLAQDLRELEEIHCRLIDGHVRDRSALGSLGRMTPPYASIA